MSGKWDLPEYISQQYQDNYKNEFNQTLVDWFNSDGFYLPPLTAADVTNLLALDPPMQPPRIWFNTTLGKAQLLVAVGTVETITST